MNDVLDQAITIAKGLPAERQQQLGEALLALIDEISSEGAYPLSAELLAALEHSSAQIDRGEVMTDAEVEAMFARFET